MLGKNLHTSPQKWMLQHPFAGAKFMTITQKMQPPWYFTELRRCNMFVAKLTQDYHTALKVAAALFSTAKMLTAFSSSYNGVTTFEPLCQNIQSHFP